RTRPRSAPAPGAHRLLPPARGPRAPAAGRRGRRRAGTAHRARPRRTRRGGSSRSRWRRRAGRTGAAGTAGSWPAGCQPDPDQVVAVPGVVPVEAVPLESDVVVVFDDESLLVVSSALASRLRPTS